MPDVMEARDERARVLGLNKVSDKGFTYKEYYSWGEDVHCELIDGMVHMLAAPLEWHQFAVGDIFRQLGNWLQDKTCRVYIAPFDVRLFPPKGDDDGSDTTVVQPDVLVVCDMKKLADGRACKGAPDFVVEVASSGTKGKDFREKKTLYEKAGVGEYWVVDVEAVYRYALVDGRFQETVHELEEGLEIEVGVLPGCRVSFRRIVTHAL